MKKGNLFNLPAFLPDEEVFEPLVSHDGVLIERIVSTGQTTPEGEWYDQDRDEWVALLQGEATLAYKDGEICELRAGDYLLIPAHRKHRVEFTSITQPCIWLAVHARLEGKSETDLTGL